MASPVTKLEKKKIYKYVDEDDLYFRMLVDVMRYFLRDEIKNAIREILQHG